MARNGSHRLVFQDGTVSRLMTKDEAMAEYAYPSVAEVVHVKLRKSGSAIAETFDLSHESTDREEAKHE